MTQIQPSEMSLTKSFLYFCIHLEVGTRIWYSIIICINIIIPVPLYFARLTWLLTVVSCRKNWSNWHDIERIAIVEQCFRFCLPFFWGHTVVYFGSKYASIITTYKLSKSSIDLCDKSWTFCEAHIMFGKNSKHSDN